MEWKAYPVLYFDLSHIKRLNEEELEAELMGQIAAFEKVYGVDHLSYRNTSIHLRHLVRRICEKTGQKVVVLIDDYDASYLDENKDEKSLREVRYVMDKFFAPLKGLYEYLKFFFMTGTTRYASDFLSGILNNLHHISNHKDYASICGITEEEVLTQLRPDIECLAAAEELSYEETVDKLRQTYGGYRFVWPSPAMFNPYSLFRALYEKKIGNYCCDDDVTTYVEATLKKYGEVYEKFVDQEVDDWDLYVPMEMIHYSIPILFQMGLLTIKDYEKIDRIYTLDIPNDEARSILKASQP